MSVHAVWQKLQAGAAECRNGSDEHFKQHLWMKGMADGCELALRVMAENGVVPETPEPPADGAYTVPFKPKTEDHQ